ncbi:MAG: GTP-binding protein [Cellvibrionaceae bacterium]|nr:GTP-binding protein [Cellvibrionaceae bacterium]
MAKIAASLICGFLGAGKTSLLNYILNSSADLSDTVVMVNDFGAINVDAELLISAEQKTIALSNGCLCCSVEDDLIGQLLLLSQSKPRPKRLLIETSGIADPNRVLHCFNYPQLQPHYYIDAVLTLVDIEQFNDLERDSRQLAEAQLCAADILVLNKIDLIGAEQIEDFLGQWRFPSSRVIQTQWGRVAAELIFDLGHDPSKDKPQQRAPAFSRGHWQRPGPIEGAKLQQALSQLPAEVYRVKGWVQLHGREGEALVLQQVGQRLQILSDHSPQAAPGRGNQLVFIGAEGVDMPQLLERFERGLV